MTCKRRVVVTGMAGLSPIGLDWPTVSDNLQAMKTGIRRMDEWDKYQGLCTRLGASIDNFSMPSHYGRKDLRSMGRVAKLATRASELALQDAGLLGNDIIKSGRMGVAYGSSTGSTQAIADFGRILFDQNTDGMTANSYIKMMSHTTSVNISVYFGLQGRVYATSTACTSGSQGIGYAYEAICHGQQD
ncbi:MAG: beta-ketoacyl-ACP synthase, partial [Planctomycetes bacterium]|nr:beta-ketoacyl-ACP synthase [Planctomycetota bacterium]